MFQEEQFTKASQRVSQEMEHIRSINKVLISSNENST